VCYKIFRHRSSENENGIIGFVFYGLLKKKRMCNEGNDEIGEEVGFKYKKRWNFLKEC